MARADIALRNTRRSQVKLYPREKYIIERAALYDRARRHGWSWGFLHRRLFELHKVGFAMQQRLGNPAGWIMSWNRQLASLLRVMPASRVPAIMDMQAADRQRHIAARRRRKRRKRRAA